MIKGNQGREKTQKDKQNSNVKHQEIYNMIAKSIVRKNQELSNQIELNSDKYDQSPYHIKKLKVQPQIIYVKDNKDQLVQLSEANRCMKTYISSHQYAYGKKSKTPQRFESDRKMSITKSDYYNWLENDCLMSTHSREDQEPEGFQQYFDKPNIRPQQEYNQEQIDKEQKSLIKNAIYLQKKALQFGQRNMRQVNDSKTESEHKNDSSLSKYSRLSLSKFKLKIQEQNNASNREASPFLRKIRYPMLNDKNTENEIMRKNLETLKNATIKKLEFVNSKGRSQWQFHNYVNTLKTIDTYNFDKDKIKTTRELPGLNQDNSSKTLLMSRLDMTINHRSKINTPYIQMKANTPDILIKKSSAMSFANTHKFNDKIPLKIKNIENIQQASQASHIQTFTNVTPIMKISSRSNQISDFQMTPIQPNKKTSKAFDKSISTILNFQLSGASLSKNSFSRISVSKSPTPLRYPFNNYCRNCKIKNDEFLQHNQTFHEFQRNDGTKFLINAKMLEQCVQNESQEDDRDEIDDI